MFEFSTQFLVFGANINRGISFDGVQQVVVGKRKALANHATQTDAFVLPGESFLLNNGDVTFIIEVVDDLVFEFQITNRTRDHGFFTLLFEKRAQGAHKSVPGPEVCNEKCGCHEENQTPATTGTIIRTRLCKNQSTSECSHGREQTIGFNPSVLNRDVRTRDDLKQKEKLKQTICAIAAENLALLEHNNSNDERKFSNKDNPFPPPRTLDV
mmetsp:Transcript_5747/g.20800  ORF Transcript_5747/g.20800 Transcript_5747/m.20800 type:complete len:212 (-) Transcript_5747:8715-9350(-)